MRRKYDRVYELKIVLEGIEPPVWRRIQVPEIYTFWDLHVAIQDAMGWLDEHPHAFENRQPGHPSARYHRHPRWEVGCCARLRCPIPASGSLAQASRLLPRFRRLSGALDGASATRATAPAR